MKCEICGTVNPEKSIFCAGCGSQLVYLSELSEEDNSDSYDHNSESDKIRKPNIISCAICGNENLANNKYCGSCGAKLHRDNNEDLIKSYFKRYTAYEIASILCIIAEVTLFIAFIVILVEANSIHGSTYTVGDAFSLLIIGSLFVYSAFIPYKIIEDKAEQEAKYRNEMSEFRNEMSEFKDEMCFYLEKLSENKE